MNRLSFFLLFLFSTFFSSQSLFAQQNRLRFISGPSPLLIIENGDTLPSAFSVGMRKTMFSSLDLDGDGKEELILKDGYSDRLVVMKRNDNGRYSPQMDYESFFPNTIGYFNLIDLNNDGIKELVSGTSTLKVYRNVAQEGQKTAFEIWIKLINYRDNGFVKELSMNLGDQPAFSDVDADGDIDILVFDLAGSFIRYFENVATGNGKPDFVLRSECWGLIQESGLNNTINMGISCSGRWIDNKKKHSGSRILALDMEGDGDMDILLSDLSFPTIAYAKNGKSDMGHPIDSIIEVDMKFPSNGKSINVPDFGFMSLVDVTEDGKEDLLITPGSASPVGNNLVWLYTNQGSSGQYDFQFTTQSFLQDEMIDIGIDAIPAFFDFDGDGDRDLLVAGTNHRNNEFFQSQISSLHLYENVGINKNAPVYKLIDDDYLGLTAKKLLSLSPTFGDVDNDGDDDLLLGSFAGPIYWYKNSPVDGKASFSLESDKLAGFSDGDYSHPCVYDIDNDGINDLFIGEYYGNINYYKGLGDGVFQWVTDAFKDIQIEDFYWEYVYDANFKIVDSNRVYINTAAPFPHIADSDADGKPDLVIGTSSGKIFLIPSVNDFSGNNADLIERWWQNPYKKNQETKNLGYNATPVWEDLNADGLLDLVIGNHLGGLEVYYGAMVPVSIDEQPFVSQQTRVFPNPTTGELILNRKSISESLLITIYSLDGRDVLTKRWPAGQLQTQLWIPEKGVYLLKVTGNNYPEIHKIVVLEN